MFVMFPCTRRSAINACAKTIRGTVPTARLLVGATMDMLLVDRRTPRKHTMYLSMVTLPGDYNIKAYSKEACKSPLSSRQAAAGPGHEGTIRGKVINGVSTYSDCNVLH